MAQIGPGFLNINFNQALTTHNGLYLFVKLIIIFHISNKKFNKFVGVLWITTSFIIMKKQILYG